MDEILPSLLVWQILTRYTRKSKSKAPPFPFTRYRIHGLILSEASVSSAIKWGYKYLYPFCGDQIKQNITWEPTKKNKISDRCQVLLSWYSISVSIVVNQRKRRQLDVKKQSGLPWKLPKNRLSYMEACENPWSFVLFYCNFWFFPYHRIRYSPENKVSLIGVPISSK